MSAKRILAIVMVSALLLAVGIGPGVTNPARALPEWSAESARGTISYAGRLTDKMGQPVADGAYDLSFTLYDTVTGGEALWSEMQRRVVVSKGEFLTTLGSVEPIPATALSGQNLWLAVSVRGQGETAFTALAPRQRLSAAVPSTSVRTAGAACPHDHLGESWSGDPGASNNGLRVESTRTDSNGITGVAHNGTNAVGVFGWTTPGVGVQGSSDSGTGVKGTSNWSTGVRAHSTNGIGLFAHSDNSHSMYVDGAGGTGLYVASAGTSGIYVLSATEAGVAVYSAGNMGMWVHSAAQDGILVDTAGSDGIHVTGPVGGVYYGSGAKGNRDFAVLNTGEVRSKVGFAAPANDFAVTMQIESEKVSYEPGDVLVVSPSGSGAAEHTTTAYSPAVVGVYSAAPAFVGGRSVMDNDQVGNTTVAILGVVPCKVSSENGPIRPGDLLVTSSTPGHAMRADRVSALPGTILGKALESLDSGTGVIQVLVTLQ